MVIGRLPDCDVVLPDTNVSRRHARIYRDGTDVVVEDLGSTNGTKVNGVRVARKVLSPGDRILLGRSTLVVEMP
jgi:pSer/pThr/pTyr-binding forkhead associated (FHA) protein